MATRALPTPLLGRDGRPVAAVSFDVDGTLYRPGLRMYLRVMVRPGAARGFRLTYRAREATRSREHDSGPALRAQVVTELASRAGMGRDEAEALLARVRERLTPVVLADMASRDAHEALRTLRAAGIRTAALSDEDTPLKLEALGLPEGLFDVVQSADESGAYKPWPRPFQRLAAALGLPASRVLHVGDRPETDGVGALRAGMAAAVLAPEAAPQGAVQVRDLRSMAAAVVAAHPPR